LGVGPECLLEGLSCVEPSGLVFEGKIDDSMDKRKWRDTSWGLQDFTTARL